MAKKKETSDVTKIVATTEEFSVVEQITMEEPKVVPAPKKAETKAPGLYYKGQRIDKVITKLGKTWAVAINGKRVKVLKSEIETVK